MSWKPSEQPKYLHYNWTTSPFTKTALPEQGFSFDKFTDDHGLRKLPTIRRSRGRFCLPTIRRSQDGFGRFSSPTIRRSHLGFFAESYRRSDDHNSVFFAKVTDDPTITFSFFCWKLPTIRRSQLAFFCESYRRSDDQIRVFLPNVTDDPTITFGFFLQLLDIDTSESALSIFFEIYRLSDDPTSDDHP